MATRRRVNATMIATVAARPPGRARSRRARDRDAEIPPPSRPPRTHPVAGHPASRQPETGRRLFFRPRPRPPHQARAHPAGSGSLSVKPGRIGPCRCHVRRMSFIAAGGRSGRTGTGRRRWCCSPRRTVRRRRRVRSGRRVAACGSASGRRAAPGWHPRTPTWCCWPARRWTRVILRLHVLRAGDDFDWRDRVALRSLDDQVQSLLSLLAFSPRDRSRLGVAEIRRSPLEELMGSRRDPV